MINTYNKNSRKKEATLLTLKIKEEESTNMATRDSVSQSPQKEGKLPY
jgi:hypothetical protein